MTFEHVGAGLYTFDVNEPIGFAIAGEDRIFHSADATRGGKNKITPRSAEVPEPVAVRYAWTDNPVINDQSRAGLPLTPLRIGQWPGVTALAE